MKEFIQGGLMAIVIVATVCLTLYLRWGHI